MLFSYDKDLRFLYYKSILFFQIYPNVTLEVFFELLECPKNFHKYSNPIQLHILANLLCRLVDQKIIFISEQNEEPYLHSLIYNKQTNNHQNERIKYDR